MRVEGGVEVARWSSLVNPGVRIPYFIEQLTGIQNDMVAVNGDLEALAIQGHVPTAEQLAAERNERVGMAISIEKFQEQGGRVKTDDIDFEALRGPFVHHPREPKGLREDISVGRVEGCQVSST